MRAGYLPAAIAERGSIMSNELKLYHSVASPNSRRVRMFLAEKDIAIALVQVDLVKGEQHSDAYRAINPRRVVPTLVLLALSRRGLSDTGAAGIDAEGKGARHDVGTTRRARGFCRRHGRGAQRGGTPQTPRDCRTP